MRRLLATALAALLSLLFGGGCEPGEQPAIAPCMEDDPCWDCSTMGNLVCGPKADR